MPEPATMLYSLAILVLFETIFCTSVLIILDVLFGMEIFFRTPHEMHNMQGAAMQGPEEHLGSGDNRHWG
jgi:hypothetical protein